MELSTYDTNKWFSHMLIVWSSFFIRNYEDIKDHLRTSSIIFISIHYTCKTIAYVLIRDIVEIGLYLKILILWHLKSIFHI